MIPKHLSSAFLVRRWSRNRSMLLLLGVTVLSAPLAGCEKTDNPVREILSRRHRQQQAAHEVDNLREAHSFLARMAELDETAAKQRILSFLNTWSESAPEIESWSQPELIETLDRSLANYLAAEGLDAPRFQPDDVDYLQLNYLLRRVTTWAGGATEDDPLFGEWIASTEDRLGSDGQIQLRRAAQLFDWTIRNIVLEPLRPETPAPPAPNLPAGLEFRGPGYRQTTLQTLIRGSGDPWQRARVFIELCRQAQIDACMLGIQTDETGDPQEWLVAVRIGDELFLFEPRLGIPVPGPDEVGIATLAEAREDASVLRRMNVPGWFDYPVDAPMVQQTVAMLDAPPEALARRMAQLEAGFTGETRMELGYDVEASRKAFEAIPGVTSTVLWPVAIEAKIYRMAMAEATRRDPQLVAWQAAQWGMLASGFPLAQARWEHIEGNFDRQDQEKGARVMYMEQRHPEFDIEDLQYNVDLQQSYGIRRELGQSNEEFAFRVRQIQAMMRIAKRAASYWLSLIHYEAGDYDNARNWFQKRVLGDEQDSRWEAAARYNLARSLEQLEETEQAIELYKTIGDPQEHGNRIRARLLDNQTEKGGPRKDTEETRKE